MCSSVQSTYCSNFIISIHVDLRGRLEYILYEKIPFFYLTSSFLLPSPQHSQQLYFHMVIIAFDYIIEYYAISYTLSNLDYVNLNYLIDGIIKLRKWQTQKCGGWATPGRNRLP